MATAATDFILIARQWTIGCLYSRRQVKMAKGEETRDYGQAREGVLGRERSGHVKSRWEEGYIEAKDGDAGGYSNGRLV